MATSEKRTCLAAAKIRILHCAAVQEKILIVGKPNGMITLISFPYLFLWKILVYFYCRGSLYPSIKKVHRFISHCPLHLDIQNIKQIRPENKFLALGVCFPPTSSQSSAGRILTTSGSRLHYYFTSQAGDLGLWSHAKDSIPGLGFSKFKCAPANWAWDSSRECFSIWQCIKLWIE